MKTLSADIRAAQDKLTPLITQRNAYMQLKATKRAAKQSTKVEEQEMKMLDIQIAPLKTKISDLTHRYNIKVGEQAVAAAKIAAQKP